MPRPRWSVKKAIRGGLWMWSPQEDKFLQDSAGKLTPKQIAARLGRSRGAVGDRVGVLGLDAGCLRTRMAKCSECKQPEKIHFNSDRCQKCQRRHQFLEQKKWKKEHPEYVTLEHHAYWIVKSQSPNSRNYKGMPICDGWNPYRGGRIQVGVDWIIANIGKRPKGASLHIIHHDLGLVPGNLEWASPRKQSNQVMFKIVAQQRHRINELEAQLAQAQQSLAIAA
jgi:hypothetical protein